jgi:hypothetical protein
MPRLLILLDSDDLAKLNAGEEVLSKGRGGTIVIRHEVVDPPPLPQLPAYRECLLCSGAGVVNQHRIGEAPEVIQCPHCRARAKAERG